MTFWNDNVGVELGMLALAFVLSLAVGVERSRKQKSAGLRTHVLVGMGSAIFTLVSAYGFSGVGSPMVDPSRIAAQVVSGIGFLGAGVIFVRNNAVSGLTSAATIWVVAAIGMSCGAGMPALAIAGTLLHLLTVGPLSRVGDRLRPGPERLRVSVRYRGDRGVLRLMAAAADDAGAAVAVLGAVRDDSGAGMTATVEFFGPGLADARQVLIETIASVKHVQSVLVLEASDE